jgi:hypothetical protein
VVVGGIEVAAGVAVGGGTEGVRVGGSVGSSVGISMGVDSGVAVSVAVVAGVELSGGSVLLGRVGVGVISGVLLGSRVLQAPHASRSPRAAKMIWFRRLSAPRLLRATCISPLSAVGAGGGRIPTAIEVCQFASDRIGSTLLSL